MKRTFAILMMIVVFAVNTMAQDYRFEIGAALGTSGYLGDVNRGNFMRNPGVSGGALFRFIKDYRWAFKGSLNAATISGNSTATSAANLLNSYKGMYAGFELQKDN